MISPKSTLFLFSVLILALAADSRAIAAQATVNMGSSMETVICPLHAADKADAYDVSGRALTVKLEAYEPVIRFQGWGKNEMTLNLSSGHWKVVRVKLPHQASLANQDVYVYEGFIAAKGACEKRIGPRIALDPKIAKVDISYREDIDEGEEEGGDDPGQAEDSLPPLVHSVTSSVRNLINGLNSPACCLMPTENRPNSFLVGMGRFGWGRPGRIHAGVDLYGRIGQKIRAVAPGEVIRAPYFFKQNTMAVDVRHEGGFVVRYGEISQRNFNMDLGEKVTRGQQVGAMAKLHCCEPMLHMELYSGSAQGALSLKHVGKYWRRSDLVDPTPFVKKWPLR